VISVGLLGPFCKGVKYTHRRNVRRTTRVRRFGSVSFEAIICVRGGPNESGSPRCENQTTKMSSEVYEINSCATFTVKLTRCAGFHTYPSPEFPQCPLRARSSRWGSSTWAAELRGKGSRAVSPNGLFLLRKKVRMSVNKNQVPTDLPGVEGVSFPNSVGVPMSLLEVAMERMSRGDNLAHLEWYSRVCE
jgi:hypothetical protein